MIMFVSLVLKLVLQSMSKQKLSSYEFNNQQPDNWLSKLNDVNDKQTIVKVPRKILVRITGLAHNPIRTRY